ncbi:CLUMA_CG018313, isoform A [Clunio marinus]|uniref:CLUMA_CG018313, isoform A n=1 Tax=Clunio marinus TaxID=568069 RepID=A0A1J1IXA8_9DIPT|nr:CLUMA_CG018313, isoform A [Clunio marinus]
MLSPLSCCQAVANVVVSGCRHCHVVELLPLSCCQTVAIVMLSNCRHFHVVGLSPLSCCRAVAVVMLSNGGHCQVVKLSPLSSCQTFAIVMLSSYRHCHSGVKEETKRKWVKVGGKSGLREESLRGLSDSVGMSPVSFGGQFCQSNCCQCHLSVGFDADVIWGRILWLMSGCYQCHLAVKLGPMSFKVKFCSQ